MHMNIGAPAMGVNPREPNALTTEVDLVALNARAVRTSVDVMAQATAADMDRPTPCAGWTLHGLLAHMTTQHYGFAAASRGEGDPALWKPRPLGDDPVEAYRVSAQHVLAAFAADGVLDQMFPLPEIDAGRPFPAMRAIGFHFIDYVVHSWDVARTLGITVGFEPELLDVALVVARAVPVGDARLAPGAAFAPEVSWSGGSRLDEIVAILGRSPAWPR
ncbi:TIGR03086 family metal-binding protein [Streptosporangium sp. NPDC087985]|uniref:TIGR03086 family metal-binding protein n=1 Tax=Streptosporangium sp. NPDC087985 TaxID=3366196 RepID=UPI00382CB464